MGFVGTAVLRPPQAMRPSEASRAALGSVCDPVSWRVGLSTDRLHRRERGRPPRSRRGLAARGREVSETPLAEFRVYFCTLLENVLPR